jgi:hypothetical protein
MMTRLLTYVRLFDIDVKHIPGSKNGAADSLSRRGTGPDDYFESRLYSISARPLAFSRLLTHVYLSEGEYTDDDLILGRYLETLKRPEGFGSEEYRKLRKKSRDFLIRDGYPFKRSRKRGLPPRHVVGLKEQ